MRFRQHALALAIGLAYASVQAEVPRTAEPGKRIDNARVDLHSLPAPSEVEPSVAYPLPSGVTRAEAAAMRAGNTSLPAAQPVLMKTIDARQGQALFASGRAELTDISRAALKTLADEIRGKPGLRIAISGHTDNQPLSAATRAIYGDNQGLSEARSLAVAAYLKETLGLAAAQFAVVGFGEQRPVAGNEHPEGMARNRRVELRVWFDLPQPVLVKLAPCAPVAAADAGVPFRITIDGEPLNPAEKPLEADRQRCTDVALEQVDIQIRFDSLAVAPAMNVWTTPNAVLAGEKVEFRAWSNYLPWIKRAELRIFRAGQKPQETPLATVPMPWTGPLTWTPPADAGKELFFLLRVYDKQDRFDETALKPLTLLAHPNPAGDVQKIERERLTGYGENSLTLRNIPVAGGTVTINGKNARAGQTVEALGLSLPVADNGIFAIKQIMPAGPHTVEVKLTEADGKSAVFRRNLSIPADDWFYIVLGDLTVGKNRVDGPARLVTGDTQHYENKVYVDGRAAFYLKGKIKGEWLLTAAADTREQPFKDLFTNFSSKDPRYLLRNINPDLYYPVYGDDSTTVDDAPTSGKFYVKLEKGESHVMWGNFQTSWSGTELLQYSRGLYGAKGKFRSEETTAYGEKKTQVDAFAAEPGTLASREEFRGTGGSLYYLRRQDISQGSERVWVEVRDRDSGLVIERKLLSPAQDYEINYLQGRILLREPLSSTGSGGSLILTSALSGQPLYLVVTYEYVPGLTEIRNLTTGIRASHWLNDHVQVGLTGYRQGEAGVKQTLQGTDVTLRYKPGTYLKLEAAKSSGNGTGILTSQDGGFGFNGLTSSGVDARAQRIEVAVDLAEVTDSAKGRVSAYMQNRERGFSAPGQIALNGEAVRQEGLRADVEVAKNTTLSAKADKRDGDLLDAQNVEVAIRQKLDDEWSVTAGVRHDERQNVVANVSPTLSQNGKRNDAQLRVDYQPLKKDGKPGTREDWEAYAFVQGTLSRDGTREKNDRAGLGGEWRVTERIKLLAEVSDGNLGAGGKLGADYRLSDRSNAYMNYVVESESIDSAWRGRQGTWVSGSSYRVSDAVRLFGEARLTHGAGPQSLTQAFGADWSPNDRWTVGGKMEFGTLSDPLAGDLRRRAAGFTLGYKEGDFKYSGGLELRRDDSSVSGVRNTWLLRNTLGYQASKAWRFLGKLNVSRSSNSQGAFFDGNFHEFVVGAAYRPVDNDRWNTLFKYTNFYNVPSPGQISTSGVASDYAQKSQVFSVDTIYDVQPWLSVGGKYAFRIGQLKESKADGIWFSSRADLLVLRADWHFVKEWDALVEWRKLRVREAADARSGALLGLYRHVAPGVKIGIGYNFTRFSDDLTDLSYRSRGWFINVLGTM